MRKLINYLLVLGILVSSCQNTNETENDNSVSKTNNSEYISKENPDGSQANEDININNNSDLKTENNLAENSIKDFTYKAYPNIDYSNLAPQKQEFTINSNQDNEIETEAKVKIFIPANSLVFESGKIATGNIQFQVTEYFDYFDMIAGKQTTNNKNGHLQSGGMFVLEAYSENKKLKLKDFSELILQLPNKIDNNMMIYYGNRNRKGNMIWEIDNFSDQPYPSMICKSGRFCGVTKSFFENNFRYSKQSMIELEGDSMEYSISFDKNGYVIGTSICKDPDNVTKNIACTKFMELANVLRDTFPNMMNSNHKVIFEFEAMNYKNYKEYRRIKKEEMLAFEAKLEKEKNSHEVRKSMSVSVREDNGAERFVRKNKMRKSFYIGGLGPINIDMELKIPDAPKADIIVNESGIKKELMLLFQNKRSYLTPTFVSENSYKFVELPRNEKVVLIACYKKDGKIFFASQNLKTEKLTELFIKNFQFEELNSLEEMKERINKI